MKAVIFAGGVGTRLWPLSRKKSPKQFEKIIGNKSTLQLSVELLTPEFLPNDIYVATGKEYVSLVQQQLSHLPPENIIGEPARRDVGPAIAFWMAFLAKKIPNEPIIVIWSDHLIRKKTKFKQLIRAVDVYLQKNPERVIYFGHKPRYASENLGWIEFGNVCHQIKGVAFREFIGFRYRPDHELAQQYFISGRHCWNLGSFATTPAFFLKMYQKFSPKIYELAIKIAALAGTPSFDKVFNRYYSQMPEIHVDNAISERIAKNYALVVVDDIGWSDVGAWEALKEALQKSDEDNVIQGKVLLEDSLDNLIYNFESNKLIVGVDLEELLVVNTTDVLLVTKKSSVPKIKKLVESFQGTEHEPLT